MSEAKHTPGPWRVDPENVHDIQDSDGGLEIATTSSIVLCGGIKPPEDERDANAILIAAAPELLAACKRAFDVITNRYDPSSEDGEVHAELRIAIAKAEGGE